MQSRDQVLRDARFIRAVSAMTLVVGLLIAARALSRGNYEAAAMMSPFIAINLVITFVTDLIVKEKWRI